VLYQAVPAPVLDGVSKPRKPGGYSDSGADILHALRAAGVPLVTPVPSPDPQQPLDWVFPDTEAGITAALAAGAGVLWANTLLFGDHPLAQLVGRVPIVGQTPALVERWDDKWFCNECLRERGLPVARSILVGREGTDGVLPLGDLKPGLLTALGLTTPLVVKPVRGRGSEGVKRVASVPQLVLEVIRLIEATVQVDGQGHSRFGSRALVEEYLPGTELTVTVMPPGVYEVSGKQIVHRSSWCLPPVCRADHRAGVLPYSGEVPVSANSAVLDAAERRAPGVSVLLDACAAAGDLIGIRAPIRIDCRQRADGVYHLFDLNMKPNLTGPGRPGRDDQASLTTLAAAAIGWSYGDLLRQMLRQAW